MEQPMLKFSQLWELLLELDPLKNTKEQPDRTLKGAKKLLKENPELANATLEFEDGWKPLHLASKARNPHAILFLLQHGADVTCQTKRHRLTPLHIASNLGSEECVRCLLKFHAPIHIKDSNDLTPLHYAVAQGYRAVVEVILEEMKQRNSIQTNNVDREGNTALELGKLAGNSKVVEHIQLFLSKNLPVSLVDHSEVVELHDWLSNTVKLPQYIPAFVANGFTRLAYWAENGITADEFDSIGVSLKGHRRIINDFLSKYGEEDESENSGDDEDSDASGSESE